MRKILLAFILLLPGQSLAVPPEGVSGKLVFDEVAHGLRKYRKATLLEVRIGWVKKLAPTKDPRVAIVLGELLEGRDLAFRISQAGDRGIELQMAAVRQLALHYLPDPLDLTDRWASRLLWQYFAAGDWWRDNEADLRRRAKLLPE